MQLFTKMYLQTEDISLNIARWE